MQETWYLDADKDGFGDSDKTLMACTQPMGYAAEPGDCDDADKMVSPGVDEECNNKDDDCDGFVDEWSPANTSCGGCTVTADNEQTPTKTYYFCENPLSWEAARNACNSKMAALVADEAAEEHSYLVANLNAIDAASGPWWTGGHKENIADLSYTWLNGVNISNNDSRWVNPPGFIDGEKCVQLLSPGVQNGGKWVDATCGNPEPYICEYDN